MNSLVNEKVKTFVDDKYMNLDLYKLLVSFNNADNNKVFETRYKAFTIEQLEYFAEHGLEDIRKSSYESKFSTKLGVEVTEWDDFKELIKEEKIESGQMFKKEDNFKTAMDKLKDQKIMKI